MEKHAYVVVKAVKSFRFYILNSRIIALVPDTTVNNILTQQDFVQKEGIGLLKFNSMIWRYAYQVSSW